MEWVGTAVVNLNTPEVNALVNVVQLAILVAILKWVRTHETTEPRRAPEDDRDEPHKPA